MTPDPVYTEGDPVSYAYVKTKLFYFVILKLQTFCGQGNSGDEVLYVFELRCLIIRAPEKSWLCLIFLTRQGLHEVVLFCKKSFGGSF